MAKQENKQYSIVLSSDDGPECPLLRPFVESLSNAPFCKDLLPVIPASEMSWCAQAISRDSDISLEATTIANVSGYLVDGSPADCAVLGVFNLSEMLPDFFISGINLGTNAGLAFHYNSGTIGAARQAALAGVASVAYSLEVPAEIFRAWIKRDTKVFDEQQESWKRVSKICTELTEFFLRNEFDPAVNFFSINIPWVADSTTPWQITTLEHCTYQSTLFELTAEKTYRLARMKDMIKLQSQGGSILEDIQCLERGEISITPISLDYSPLSEQSIQQLKDSLLR